MKLLTAAVCAMILLSEAASAQSVFNRNRALDRDEYLTAQSARFDKLDADDDGVLTESEYVAARLAEFDKADRNGDGALTRGEARGFESAAGGRNLQRASVEASAARTFTKIAPGGSISKEDYLAARGAAFDKADRNGDGQLTRGEARGLTSI